MRSQLSNFNASLLAPGGSTASLGSGTPQRPPRRRAQSVGNSAYGSSLALASSTPRGSLFNAVSPERGKPAKVVAGPRTKNVANKGCSCQAGDCGHSPPSVPTRVQIFQCCIFRNHQDYDEDAGAKILNHEKNNRLKVKSIMGHAKKWPDRAVALAK